MTAHPAGTGVPAYSETVPCTAASARRARLLVTTALDTWGLPDMIEAGILLMSELVANAVEHTRSRNLRVIISRPEPDRVRVAVVDMSRTHPSPRTTTAEEEHGRGLVVIAALSDNWGTDPLRWGKRVWADLHAEAAP
ncbi:ATP-binding protein [Streptomyces olivoreticuli]